MSCLRHRQTKVPFRYSSLIGVWGVECVNSEWAWLHRWPLAVDSPALLPPHESARHNLLLFLRLAVRSTRIRMFPSVTQSPHKERQERAEARRRNPRRGTRKIICTAAAPKGPAFSFLNYLGRSRKYFGTSRKYFWQKPRHIRAESQQTSAESQQNA